MPGPGMIGSSPGRNNIVLAGPGDDHIDLDPLRVEYQVMQKDNICRL